MGELFSDSKSIDIYPYSFGSKDLDLKIEQCKLLSEDSKNDARYVKEYSNASKSLDLTDRDDYSKIELQGKIHFKHDDLLKRVLSDEDLKKDDIPVKLVLISKCGYTFERHIESTEKLYRGISGVQVNFTVDAGDFYGKMDIIPVLVRTDEGSINEHQKSSRLADGRNWTVRMDDFEGPSTSLIDSEMRDFSNLEDMQVDPEDLYHLDLKKNPVLYLNKDHPDIENMLKCSNNRKDRSKARDAVFDMIVQSVFTQLVEKAIWDLGQNHDYRFDWEEDVMDIFLEHLFPNQDMDEGEMLDEVLRIRDELGSGSNTSDEYMNLINNLHLGIQRDQKIKSHVKKLAEVI